MTTPRHPDRAISDPIGTIANLVAAIEPQLAIEQIRTMVTSLEGGRAKARRLASHLAEHPGVLTDSRSPAPRAIGDLLIALREAGASHISPPCCADCGKPMRTFQRRGQDWYCWSHRPQPQPCAACGNTRRITTRDRAGRPRCKMCPDLDDRDPITVIHALVTALDPAADREAIANAVHRSTARPSYQQKLAWALETDPGLLTGDGHLSPLRAMLRLIDLLHTAGIAGVVPPACPRCHRVVRIDKPLDGQRVCRTCIAHSRLEDCSRCGAHREPATRDGQGRPLCPNCLITDPANLEPCINCGRRRLVDTRTPDGPICPSCPALRTATCSICGENRPCGTSRITGRPWCPTCQRRTASCSACGRIAAVISGTLAEPLCVDCTAPEVWHTCPTCTDPDHPHPGQCARCLLNQRLNKLLGAPAETLYPGLQALRLNIATAEYPVTANRWLNKPSIAPVLADLAAGRRPLTHQALDELPDSQPLAHLRQVLVSVGALPERDEHMARIERFLAGLLASQQDPDQRSLLHRYATWHIVRRLRGKNNGRPATPQQFNSIRQHTHAAVAFLGWLATHNLTLATCGQGDLDHWLTDDSATYRWTAGHFIRWARTNKLTTIHAPAHRWSGPTQPLDEQHRWDTARRLLHDGTLKSEDRLAGLLLLLYAQRPAAISRLTTAAVEVDAQGVRVHLGQAPIQLPEPVAALARAVAANRKGHATIGALTPSLWLFPGGQPGRPISTTQLTQRLNNLGIRPNQARSTALFQLATEIPAAILARTLGIHTDVAVAWQRLSAGDWTNYAAQVSHRINQPHQHGDDHHAPR
ncbi:site-specific integrase [Kitasatospora sp. NPDC096128]|uniref:site-specific integrase n=1 Tax=Kitasatospora sp. NPDC096128 TaxID=3155547 RepID=UPI0033331090